MGKTYRYGASPDDILEDYFDWLCDIVHANDPQDSFIELMRVLFETDFYWVIDNDINRAEDGKHLRGYFENQSLYSDYSIIYDKPCSVLEMLIALSIRIDEEVMWNPSKGNRAVTWFWEMLENLEIADIDDYSFCDPKNRYQIEKVLEKFLSRNYDKDGFGCLFPPNSCYTCRSKVSQKVSQVEIWYQMMDYMMSKYGVEEDTLV